MEQGRGRTLSSEWATGTVRNNHIFPFKLNYFWPFVYKVCECRGNGFRPSLHNLPLPSGKLIVFCKISQIRKVNFKSSRLPPRPPPSCQEELPRGEYSQVTYLAIKINSWELYFVSGATFTPTASSLCSTQWSTASRQGGCGEDTAFSRRWYFVLIRNKNRLCSKNCRIVMYKDQHKYKREAES